MKEESVYEIDLAGLAALWLIRWRAFVCAGLALAVLGVVWAGLSFVPPGARSEEYRRIETALASRRLAEEALEEQRRRFDENLYYSMDPEQIVTFRLTLLVELEDSSTVTDQMDPADMVVFAYHNLARSGLQEAVGTLLHPQEAEQLLSASYDTALNQLSVYLTGEDEALVRDVLALCAGWYQDQTRDVAAQTQAHRLILLPLSETRYTRAQREELVSTRAGEQTLLNLEQELSECNEALGTAFARSSAWAAERTLEELEAVLAKRQRAEASPDYLKAGVLGALAGCFLAAFWVAGTHVAKRRLPGQEALGRRSGWNYIGRLNVLPEPPDALVRRGYGMLYPDAGGGEEVRLMTELLLRDRGLSGTLGLVGDVSREDMDRAVRCLEAAGFALETASIRRDRAGANALCRSCCAVIFVGRADQVTEAQVRALEQILLPLGKVPLGYLLV